MSAVVTPPEMGLSASSVSCLRRLAGRMEQHVLQTVADPFEASPAEVELIELWRQLVLVVEGRAEGGDSPGGLSSLSLPVRAVSSVRARERAPDGAAVGGVAEVVGRDAALPTTGVRPAGGWTPAQAEVRSEPFVKGVQDDTCTTDGDRAGHGGCAGGRCWCDDAGVGCRVAGVGVGREGVALRRRLGAAFGWSLVLGRLRQLALKCGRGAVRRGVAAQRPGTAGSGVSR